MKLTRFRVKNFKSFKDITTHLKRFNVVVGANASGKSNFIRAFQFLRDISDYGLENAISLQGGVQYLRNVAASESENLRFEVDGETDIWLPCRGKRIGLRVNDVKYSFELMFKGQKYSVASEDLVLVGKVAETEKRRGIFTKTFGEGKVEISNHDRKTSYRLDIPSGIQMTIDDIYNTFYQGKKLPRNMLLLEKSYNLFPPWEPFLDETKIFDFDPRKLKEASRISARAELEEDGSNLAVVLNRILRDRGQQRRFAAALKNLLPFVEKLGVERYADKSMFFKVEEIYSRKNLFPAFMVSDGTASVVALILALYFEDASPLIFEEPERNLHPSLIEKLIALMKEVSEKKQIFVSTHNPEVVKYAGVENLLMMRRDGDGFSTVSWAEEISDVSHFLSEEVGIDELFVKNMLGPF